MPNVRNDGRMREKALRTVQAHSFAVDEARLYLDMHPDCDGARRYFDKQNALRKNAVREYENMFGPLTTDNINAQKDGWQWTDQPMPWEMGV